MIHAGLTQEYSEPRVGMAVSESQGQRVEVTPHGITFGELMAVIVLAVIHGWASYGLICHVKVTRSRPCYAG